MLRLWPALGVAHQAKEGGRLAKIGPAPEFTLTTTDGGRLSLARPPRARSSPSPSSTPHARTRVRSSRRRWRGCRSVWGRTSARRSASSSITVDPERDTPEVLAQYARNHGADPAGWAFLTGTPAEIRDVGRRYGIFAQKTERGDVDHTFLTSIVDQRRHAPRPVPRRPLRSRRVPAGRPEPPPGGEGPVIDWLPRLVARLPLAVHGKLLLAFLAIVGLLIAVGAVGLQVLSGVNRRAEDMVQAPAEDRRLPAAPARHDQPALQRVLGAARPRRPDASRRPSASSTSSATTSTGSPSSPRTRSSCFGRVREDYEEFIKVVTQVIELIRAGKAAEGRELQLSRAEPLADRLERLDERAGEQGGGRHGGEHRGEPRRLRDARSGS